MAVLSGGNLTLLDQAKRTDPDGLMAQIVELLAQTNEMLPEMAFMEGNLPTGHRTTVRTQLPLPAWRMLNKGVVPSKSTTAQIDEQTAILEAWSECDIDVVKLNGNSQAFRLTEAKAFIEAMNQEMQQTVIYGNGGLSPEEFTGLAPRYSSLTGGTADNVIGLAGAGSTNTSIWLIAWSPETVSGIFPKGSKAGLVHEDYGPQTVETVAGLPGARMRAYQERWQWQAGIAVRDYRYVVRICNIDVPTLNGATPQDLITAMERAVETLPNRLGRRAFYMNRTAKRNLRRIERIAVGAGGGTTYENVAGQRVLMFGDVPVRSVDAILNTEAAVV